MTHFCFEVKIYSCYQYKNCKVDEETVFPIYRHKPYVVCRCFTMLPKTHEGHTSNQMKIIIWVWIYHLSMSKCSIQPHISMIMIPVFYIPSNLQHMTYQIHKSMRFVLQLALTRWWQRKHMARLFSNDADDIYKFFLKWKDIFSIKLHQSFFQFIINLLAEA